MHIVIVLSSQFYARGRPLLGIVLGKDSLSRPIQNPHSSGVALSYVCFAIINKINSHRECLEGRVGICFGKRRN